MAHKYNVISADSHIEISPDRWRDRVPAQYRDQAPKLIKLPHGGDGVIVEGQDLYVLGAAITGKPYSEHRLYGINYDGAPGAGTSEQRVHEQDIDGVDAEVMYTSAGNSRFWRGIRDDDAYTAVIHAYNEFLAEEYCAPFRDRLLAMGVMPMTNTDDVISEMEYCARAGLKGIMLGTFPSGKGYPTPDDDRFWAAAIDLDMPITVHTGFQSGRDAAFRYKKQPGAASGRSDPISSLASGHGKIPMQLAFGGVFDRFPSLQIYIAETNVGWLPYFLDQLNNKYERQKWILERDFDVPPLKRLPTEYVRDHCWWGFLWDNFGVEHRHMIGVDHIMWENDFPHAAGDWPHSREVIADIMEGVPDDERHLMLAGNAVRFFHLEDD